MLIFTLKTMLRRVIACLLLVLLIAGGTVGMLLLSGMLEAQHAAIDKAYAEARIEGMITNISGTSSDGLCLKMEKVEALKECELIEELALKRSYPCKYPDLELEKRKPKSIPIVAHIGRFSGIAYRDVAVEFMDYDKSKMEFPNASTLVGVTYPERIEEFSNLDEGAIEYFEGYDSDDFLGEELYCIVPEVFLELLPYDVTGTYMYLRYQKHSIPPITDTMDLEDLNKHEEEASETVIYKVIGTYDSKDNVVYCPFQTLQNEIPEQKQTHYSDIAKFIIADNRKTDEMRNWLKARYREPLLNAEDEYDANSYLLLDDLFEKTIEKSMENVQLIEILLPILHVVGAGIGFLASFLFIRSRTREFAVMRSMGVKRTQVVFITFCEQLLLAVIGAGITICIFLLAKFVGDVSNGLLFVGCYLFGALVSTIWITNVNVMKLLKQE